MGVIGIFFCLDGVFLSFRHFLALIGLIDTVFHGRNAVADGFQTVGKFFFIEVVEHGLIVASPVVRQGALAPFLLKLRLACCHCRRVIEIPNGCLLGISVSYSLLSIGSWPLATVLLAGSRPLRFFLLFLLLLLQLFYHLLDFLQTSQ